MKSKPDKFLLDHNASAKVRDSALEAFVQATKDGHANPAALHRPGRQAQGVLEAARDRVASALGVTSKEVIFVGTATEANNLALLGAANARLRLYGKPCPLISFLGEHPSVLGPLRHLQQLGSPLQLLGCDSHGFVDPVSWDATIQGAAPTTLVALQWANNETGAVQRRGWTRRPPGSEQHWHCDAVQGVGKRPLAEMPPADTMSLSGHKLGAPKGIAVLIKREGALVDPIMFGGGHQKSMRPGTESPALALAFAVALEESIAEQGSAAGMVQQFSEDFLAELAVVVPNLRSIHPPTGDRLFNTLCLHFPNVDGRALLPALDAEGIAASSGSACSSGAPTPSTILRACGLSDEEARATIRFSFSHQHSKTFGSDSGKAAAKAVQRLYKVGNP